LKLEHFLKKQRNITGFGSGFKQKSFSLLGLLAKKNFYWRFSKYIGEKLILLAIMSWLLAKISFYWRLGNFQ
jgi:hypothetical protein